MDAGHVDGDAVHLPLDQQREVVGAHVGLGLVEIEEDLPLGIERRLRRVHVLGPGLFIGIERARGEGDGLTLLIGNGKGNALAETGVERAMTSVGLLLGAEEAAGAHGLFAEVRPQAIAHVVEVVGRIADAEPGDGLHGNTASGEVLASAGGFGRLEIRLEVLRRSLVDVDELTTKAGFAGLFRRAELALGQRDAALGGDDTNSLGETDVLELHDEGEDVALLVAAEAVEVAVVGVDRERTGLLFVKRTEPGVVLRAGLAQLDVVADDFDDIGLLLDGLGEVI